MRRFALALLWLALASSPAVEPPAQALGAVAKALKSIARSARVADEAALAAQEAQTVNRIGRLSPELRAAVREGRGGEFAAAFREAELEIELATMARRPNIDIRTFERLLAQPPQVRKNWDKGVPLADDMPNIIVRAPGMPGAGNLFRVFAYSRLQRMLDEPFDVADMRVVVAGLADEAASSAAELAAFRRTIPAGHWDEVGYLAHLDGAALSRAEMVRRLEVYRGQTVMIVGHVPDGLTDFIVHLPGGEIRQLNMRQWLDAADEAGVNLVAIGCNSERLGRLGARGILNSKRVRLALRDVIERQPQTIGDFFRELTSANLQIVIDPVSARLFSNGLIIRERETGQLVGQLMLGGARVTRALGERSFSSGLSSDFSGSLPEQMRPCFASPSHAAFQSCVAATRARDAAKALAATRACHAHNLRVLPQLVDQARRRLDAARRSVRLWSSLLAGGGLLLAWLAIASAKAREDEQDKGGSPRHLFNRWRVREAAALFAPGGFGTAAQRLAVAGSIIGLTALFFFAAEFPWFVWIAYVFVGLVLIGLVVEFGKSAFLQLSAVDAVIALAAAFHVAAAAGYFLAQTRATERQEALARVTETRATYSSASSKEDCFEIDADYGDILVTVAAPDSY